MVQAYEPCRTSLVLDGVERELRLPLIQIVELQNALEASIKDIILRIASKDYYAQDCLEVMIAGLIGGGMPRIDARNLMAKITENTPVDILWFMSQEVLGCCLAIYEPDEKPVEKPRADKEVGWILWPQILLNAAVMGIQPSEIAQFSNWEYSALVNKWEVRNEDPNKVEPPTKEEYYQMRQELIDAGYTIQ